MCKQTYDGELAVDAHMQVMEYVQERASLYELTKAVTSWERKVEISEVRHQPIIVMLTMVLLTHADGTANVSPDLEETVFSAPAFLHASHTPLTHRHGTAHATLLVYTLLVLSLLLS